MSTSVRNILLIGTIVIFCGCAAGKPSGWGHFHGDLRNQGFQQLNSGFALSSAWISDPYEITSASPVIGRDFQNREVIYIGTTDGRLVAIQAENGRRKWQRFFGSSGSVTRIVASPSVSDAGDIYVITSRQIENGRARSALHKVDQFGNLKWSYVFPDEGFTTGAPKALSTGAGTLVFVYVSVGMIHDVRGELFVLRDDGQWAAVLDRKPLAGCRYDNGGGSPALQDVLGYLKNTWNFVGDFPVKFDDSGVGLPVLFVDPTVAVVTGSEKVRIAIADNLCSIGAFEWDGSKLTVLWREEHNFHKHSSAAVLPNGLMVFGRDDGHVLAYDVGTGAKMWEYDAGQPVFATPAALTGQVIFVVSKNHLHVVRAADGTLIMDDKLPRKLDLSGQTYSSPAVTENRVYVAAAEMLTVTYDLKTRGHDSNFHGNGLASVAVGNDGGVYAVAEDGTVRKYSSTE